MAPVKRICQRALRPVAAVLIAIGCHDETQPTPPSADSAVKEVILPKAAVIIGVGDIAVCGTNGDEQTATLVDSVLRSDSVARIPTLVATFGDNAYPSGGSGAYDAYPRCFTPSWGKPRIMRVIRPSPGNHDYANSSPTPYFDYFGASAGPTGKGYYSYDFAGWHLVSLNSEISGGRDNPLAQEQENWLRQDLKNHPALCTIAYFHRPLFSSGTHGAGPQVRALWDMLYEAHADLILNGHDHLYERFSPQNPGGALDPANGIEEIVVGTGGGNLTSARAPLARNSLVHIQGHFGVLKLQLGAGEYRHAFLDTDRRVWDQGGRRCH